jgi:DNA-binding response OmpR family regulator
MKILVVEDDELIANLIDHNLRLEGFETMVCHDGLDAIDICNSSRFDMIVLDIMLPGMDGFHVCKELQSKGIPIIMLTAKNDISDKLAGLEAGADDYLVKPFDSRELVARIRTILRRLDKAARKLPSLDLFDVSEPLLSVDEEARRLFINNIEIELTQTEFDLVLLFSKNPNRVFTRAQLMDLIWGYDFLGDSRTVDIHIQRIRKKLGSFSSSIETVFGVGYRFKELKK